MWNSLHQFLDSYDVNGIVVKDQSINLFILKVKDTYLQVD